MLKNKWFRSFLIIGLLLAACSSLRLSDHEYNRGPDEIAASVTEEMRNAIIYYGNDAGAGCSAIVLNSKNGKSYIASANHCFNFCGRRNVTWFKKTPQDTQRYPILKVWNNSIKDITFYEVDGELPAYHNLAKDRPIDNGADIIIGWVDGVLTILVGRAIPGTSGGGCFNQNGQLWGCVSTTSNGPSIYPALKELGLLWILDD